MADNVFTNTPTNDAPSFDGVTLDTLVGENQKYKSPDELAKAYAHADAALAARKAKEAEMEAELKVLRDIVEKRTSPVNNDPPRQETPPVVDDRPKNEDKDFKTLIRKELDEKLQEDRFATNVNKVSETLANHFGNGAKASEFITSKAKELEVSVDWLMDVAGRSPEALFRTIGFEPNARSASTPNASVSDVNTSALRNNGARRNFKHYEDLRKSDSKLYYSVPMQKQMFNDAREQGSAFYS